MQLLPATLEVVVERAGPSGHAEQHVADMHGVWENGLHHRLLQRVDPGPGARDGPLPERVGVGERETRRRRAGLQILRAADLVAERPGRLRGDGSAGEARGATPLAPR